LIPTTPAKIYQGILETKPNRCQVVT